MIEPFRLWLGISRRELDSNDERVWFLFDFDFHLNNLWYSVFGKLFRKFAHCWIKYAFLGLKRICLYFLNFLNGYQLWSTPKGGFNDAFFIPSQRFFCHFFFDFSNETKIHNDFNIIIFSSLNCTIFELQTYWSTFTGSLDSIHWHINVMKKMEIHLVLLFVYI